MKILRRAIVLLLALTSGKFVRGQLIRSVDVYQEIIKGIHDYFNNTCIILLHSTPNPVESQGLQEGSQLLKLQTYLSGRHIRTTYMDFDTFTTRVGQSYFHIKRPLFVILNDSEEVKHRFSHVTSWIDMSYPTWLIFFRDETTIKEFFMEIYVPFDCTFMVAKGQGNQSVETITEVYQVDRGRELRYATFGTWHPKNGITTPRIGLYQRRNDLYGQTIRVASIHDPPGSTIIRDSNGSMIGLGGFFGGIMQLLEENMNITVTYQESTTWGYLANGTWTGAIGMLTENKVDIVAAELMMTVDRLNAIDFTTPVYTTKCRTFIKRPLSSPLKWKAYLAPFHYGIWSSIGILMIVTSAVISLVKSIVPIVLSNLHDVENSPSNFTDILLAVFGAFCSQGMEPSLLDPIRMIHFVIHLTGVVVLAAYSAALISSLAVKTFVMPFTTMEGLLKDGTYRFSVVGNSADYSFFQNTSDDVLQVLFDEILAKEKELPNNYFEGLQRVCKEENYAFMTLDNVVSQLQPKVNCKLEPLDMIMQTSIGMAVRSRSPYKGIINSNILLIRDSGILQRLLNNEWVLSANKGQSNWTTVEIGDVLPLVLVILFGTFFSVLTLGSENVVSKRRFIKRKKPATNLKEQVLNINEKFRNVVSINLSRL